jgi:hypothetical protein
MDAQERGAFLTHRLTEYQQLWSKFMDMFSAALKKQANEITEEEEMQFRELQAEVIRRTQFLGYRMPRGVFDIGEGVHNLFTQSFSLRCIRTEPSIKITDLRSQWHDISIALNKMHGQLRAALEGTVSHKGKKRH